MQQHVHVIAKVCKSAGIAHVVVSPGSRSAPLLYAFLHDGSFKIHSITDERTAGFFALGIAIQLQQPVVLICTSGTAALNYFPSVAEAYYQKVPLLILTADRPPELLNQQDGQMIMQKGVYGSHVIASHELPCLNDSMEVYLLTEKIVFQSIRESLSFLGPGPVHINVPLREPLYQIGSEINYDIQTKNELQQSQPHIQIIDLNEAIKAFKSSSKRLIIIGHSHKDPAFEELIYEISSLNNTVLIADVASNLQHLSPIKNFDAILQYANIETLNELKPDFILSLGGPLVSKSLKLWLKNTTPDFHFRVQNQPTLVDTYNNVTHFCIANPKQFLQRWFYNIKNVSKNTGEYPALWQAKSKEVWSIHQKLFSKKIWFEPNVLNEILNYISPNDILHIGNSSVIRFVSWIGIGKKFFSIHSNRGTSGIDGIVSTAIGSAVANPDKKHILLTGDLSFWYDSNAFWLNQKLPDNLIVFVFNNGEGGIFNWIDGPQNLPEYLHYFTTPQNRNIAFHLKQFDVEYFFASNFDKLNEVLKEVYIKNKTTVVELVFNNDENYQLIKEFKNQRL